MKTSPILLAALAAGVAGLPQTGDPQTDPKETDGKPSPEQAGQKPDEKPEQEQDETEEKPSLVIPACANSGDVLARARALANLYAIDKNMLATIGGTVLTQDSKGRFSNDADAIMETIDQMYANMKSAASNLIALRDNPGVHANFKDNSLSARRVAESFAQVGKTDLRIINKALR